MDINPFRLCSGLRVLGYFMILIVLAVVLLSYYAVVVLTWGPHLLDGGFDSFLSFTIIITFHILLVMLMWSYIKVVIQDPGSVPENWKLVSEQNIEEGNSVALSDYASIENPTPTLSTEQIERRQSQSRGYCSKCQNGKPPRCHHCSVCQRCVLKMDHHCIWVVNCVGARNYKFFLLFVVYTFLTTTLDTLVLLPSFVKFFRQAKNHSLSPGNIAVIFLVFVLNLAFSLSLLCFVIMHASLLSSNTTSVEVYEKKKCPRWKYDLGWKRNFEQVFGASIMVFSVFLEERFGEHTGITWNGIPNTFRCCRMSHYTGTYIQLCIITSENVTADARAGSSPLLQMLRPSFVSSFPYV